MSWDVLIMNTRGKTPAMEELRDSDCDPLGKAADVRKKLSKHLPGIDWSEKSWGHFQGDGYHIEFNVGHADPLQTIMLHVHGGGDVIAAIVRFARPLGWSALDCSTSEFLDLDDPSQAGWEGFQGYRDKVLKRVGVKKPGQPAAKSGKKKSAKKSTPKKVPRKSAKKKSAKKKKSGS
jgi:hypothetical protein